MKTKRKQRHPRILTGSNKALRVICEPVVFDEIFLRLGYEPDLELHELVKSVIRDMTYCLTKRKHGVGLAANQIGSNLRIIIVKKEHCVYDVMINPVIIDHSPKSNWAQEGCLSYPGILKRIKRYNGIAVKYSDEFGVERTYKFEGYSARIVQHEIDHLDGLCKVGETK
jgi:peptide deformylase